MSSDQAPVVALYEYPSGEDPGPSPWPEIPVFSDDGVTPTAEPEIEAAPAENLSANRQQEIDQEMRRNFEAGRKQGLEEGCNVERDAHTERLRVLEAQRREQHAALLLQFEAARDLFLKQVEREVVALALAVAARILRREAQMDPLLLTGAVRVALGQLAETTQVCLHVPSQEMDLWTEALAHLPHLRLRPEVVAEEGLAPGDCRIETEIGSVDLGLRAQLSEIERGFFDQVGAATWPIEAPRIPHEAVRGAL